ncbi:maltose O-acetyltransferase [Lapidilactobacillus concavus DSM 17758]|uniref:Acetyltransferase n=1 Tax=Lapidilactobacillus concavus DSM 17758 TaxID=1423735 RepID=A0A0R1W4W8_9LACO|nr:sugar O-acetyltransferase [Lapidilactobacillus concavus]KRM10467.1 maltose O-acetyltransferase [Lapidilactobacillus concavus DSM 17758]GEL12761.1 galactoside O-acetyltransferase [Lapidilactobacillus concavus]
MTTEQDLMLAGKLYRSGDAEIAQLRQRAQGFTRRYNATTELNTVERKKLLAEYLDVPSNDAYIETPLHLDYGFNVHLGKNFYGNYELIILDTAAVTIGDNVMIGPRVSLLTAGHPTPVDIRNSGIEYGHPITIGNNVWIGGNVVVNPGVTIGDNSVIGSGSVITKDIPANTIAVGNPCHILREISDQDREIWERQAQEYHQLIG